MSVATRTAARPVRRFLVTGAAALLAAGCVPRVQEAGPRTDAPAIAGAVLEAADGARLPLHAWLPATAAKAVIVGVHGFNDYGNAFAIPATRWAANGFAVYAYDQRGFGAAPAPGIWAGRAVLVDDLADAVAAVRRRHPGLPVAVVGESMGAAVAMLALADRRLDGIAGTVLLAPAVWARETMPLGHRVLLWLASHLAPWLTVTGRGLDITPSDNIEMLRALAADPLVIKETRVDAIHGLVDLMDAAFAEAGGVGDGVLLLYGAHDEVVPAEPTRAVACRLPPGRRLAVYADGYHMLLRDLEGAAVQDDVAAWIADPARPLPSGSEAQAGAFFACALDYAGSAASRRAPRTSAAATAARIAAETK